MCKSTNNCGCCGSKILLALVIVGAVNWGLYGAFDLDVVQIIFGSVEWLQDLIYILVGVAGLALLFGGCRCKACKTDEMKGGCCGSGNCGPKKDDTSLEEDRGEA